MKRDIVHIILFISICVGISFTATGIPSSSVMMFGEYVVRDCEYSCDSLFNLKSEDLQRNKLDYTTRFIYNCDFNRGAMKVSHGFISVATIGAGGIAAATSATYAAASMGVVPGVMSGMASGAANGLVLGFGNTVVGGGSIGTAFAAGGIEAITGALSSGLTGGIDGGIRAARAGVNIMSGKVGPMDISGHMGRSINDLSLPTYDNKPNVPSDKMYTVYVGYERDTKVVRYVGITKREPEIRYQEHWRSKTPRANLDYKNVTKIHSLTRMEARIKEQNLINYYGLKNLYNKRNEIAPKHWIDFGITPKFTITIPYIRNSNPFFNTKN